MISIKITKKYNALVDDDYEYLKTFSWSVIRPGGKVLYAVRRMFPNCSYWNMSWDVVGKPEKGFVVDHIDGQGLNNTRANLRIITQRQNCQNRHQQSTSIYPGVSKSGNKWIAHFMLGKKLLHLGSYDVELDAANAYKAVNDSLGLPEVIQPFTEKPKADTSLVTRNEYFRILQMMKRDGLSDEEIDKTLSGFKILEDEAKIENLNL